MNNESALFVDDYEEALCQKVEILEKRIFIETGEEELLVKVHSQDNGMPFRVSRKELVKRSFFDKLTHHGLSVIEDDDSYSEIRSAINESERKAPVVYYHEQLGFRVLHGKSCFLAYHPIGDLNEQELSSVNIGIQKILEPQGSLEKWRDFVRQHIVCHTERSLALMLGATAPIAYILKEEGIFVDVPVWAFINSTSKGKTTLLYLIASMYANPRYFIDNFNATSGALYAMLEERRGYPFLCDEATHIPNIDLEELFYTLPTGKEKRRLNNKGKLRPMVEFSGAVVITSESSLLDRSKGYGGEEARIIEFSVNCFEKEPTLPDKMRELCFKNYGWVTEPLIKLLLDNAEKEKLIKKYRRFLKHLQKSVTIEITGVERRKLQRYALILTSGWLLRKAIQCNFDLQMTERYLIEDLKNKIVTRDDRDEADKMLDKIKGFVCSNREKFPTAEALTPLSRKKHYSSFWGATGFYCGKSCLWIQEDVLKKPYSSRRNEKLKHYFADT